MARRVFFAFYYQDVIDFRANVVRNHWLTKDDREDAGFFDASLWESAKRRGTDAVKRLIDAGLENTSATCVLIGSQTFARPWVRYEILKSMKRGNKLLGVHINGIPDKYRQAKDLGPDPFDSLTVAYGRDGASLTMFEHRGGQWVRYGEIDGSASYSITPAERMYWGKSFKLSHFYPTYKWNGDDGYKNFAKWVE